MVFSSTTFLFVFLPAVIILYFINGNRTYRNMVLLFSSILFYAWGEPLFVFVVIIETLINWAIGLKLGSVLTHRKLLLSTAVIIDVLTLGIFKYLTFITRNIAMLFGNNRFIVNIALPIGISFFTFQLMSYVFDVYYGNASPQKNPIDVLLYIVMFPQLIAGPIVRYQTVANDIKYRAETKEKFTEGIIKFSYGLGKKLLLANYLGMVADKIFGAVGINSVCSSWLGAVCYTLQIYFDFSGYSDMAVGLGKIFGFSFPDNFNYPYAAKSVNDFWRRWHISLSTWFRDYVYIPLGGNRVSRKRWIFNLFTVWLLTGIWHGANWTFIVWGLLYFVFLLTEKIIGVDKVEKLGIISHFYTLIIVILLWTIFRSDSLNSAIMYIGSMLGIGTSSFCDDKFWYFFSNVKFFMIAAAILSCPLYKKVKEKMSVNVANYFDAAAATLTFLLCVMNVVDSTYNPFIYFNF